MPFAPTELLEGARDPASLPFRQAREFVAGAIDVWPPPEEPDLRHATDEANDATVCVERKRDGDAGRTVTELPVEVVLGCDGQREPAWAAVEGHPQDVEHLSSNLRREGTAIEPAEGELSPGTV